MALVVPDAGEISLLNTMLKAALSTDENQILKLFKNDYTPDSTSVSGSFTEANFTNYAAKTMTRANWSTAVTVAGKAETSYGSVQSWTCGATGNTIYGYLVVGATSGTVLWAERFSSPRVLASSDILNLQPKFNLSSAS